MAAIQPPHAVHATTNALPGTEILTHFAGAFFTLTLLTDFFYMRTVVLMWQDFSSWLLFFGLIAGGLAALLWLISFATDRIRPVWGAVVLYAIVLVVAVINSLIHALDGWPAVVPWGITLSGLTCLLMLGAAFLHRREVTHRPAHRR